MSFETRWSMAILMTTLLGCDLTLAPSCNANGQAVVDLPERTRTSEASEEPGSAPLPKCPGVPRNGITECFPGECGPGQYCDDRMPGTECRPGCTSDSNCGSRDVCVREGDATIGRCEPCAEQVRRSIDGCGAPDRNGTTPCFPGECAPGQYCQGSHCEPGCTSDENCGPSERCERPPGVALGVCRSCDFEPSH